MGTIVLFYKYIDIQYPGQIQKWQRQLCEELGLKGRVLIAHEGINATLGGNASGIERYVAAMKAHPLFADVDFKYSDGGSEDFPRLRITVRPEIVNSGIPSHIKATNGGVHLTPEQAHAMIVNDEALLFDARNLYESRVGTFTDAVIPPINNFRELPTYIDQNLEQFKDKKVLMFCTGGVRCERATAYLKSKDVASEVYQIKGGIHRYIEQYPDGYFRGKNYVFDGRLTMKANDDVVGACHLCQKPSDDCKNCANASCNMRYVACTECFAQTKTCSPACQKIVEGGARVRAKVVGSSCTL